MIDHIIICAGYVLFAFLTSVAIYHSNNKKIYNGDILFITMWPLYWIGVLIVAAVYFIKDMKHKKG